MAGAMDDDDGDIPSLANQLVMRAMYVRASNDILTALLPSSASLAADGAAGGAPASDEAIQALKEVAIIGDDVQQLDCAICLDHQDDAAAAGWKEMPCGHPFHGGCLEKWLRMHGTCPMCRHQMPTAAAAEGEEALVVLVRVPRSGGGANDGEAPAEGMYDYHYFVLENPFELD
ncbi:hypothetical protein E2562_012316 [Oryza meyeriana var. granulata]|uniref:RING-type domain-containing protein n=1 Tax=Oryza meyeriana var. granulata TaxID=110450 RepID=A0A6G1DGV8_9ORYZ|nr:hypothetical protein E2562_012316 [Oryza meyeriana var. granulata]